ncbi:hypothetical protein GCM10007874_29870 [Labrys miyagiensis]|uniref:Uncharacterized protein n=1 Tax=Labrys miyagiensis TaxID=346912 RepID=A0ABQ6CII1_9HYPH|nr:hypothetical protein [Labrys miyagiensis]GLS19970.1 hypothetical protein GCM10007874_29870 [Labrys miyagiensis]
MKYANIALAAGLIGLPTTALGTTDVTVVTTPGICTEFSFAGKHLRCSALASTHTDHSQRSGFTFASLERSIRFEGGQDMTLAAHRYLLMVDTVMDGDKSFPAVGQCTAELSASKRHVLSLICEATFLSGKARVLFKSTGMPSVQKL